jgi:hypothetical protein
MALIDSAPRMASARALDTVSLIAVDRTQILQRLESADPIVGALLRGQLQRYRAALKRLGELREDYEDASAPDELPRVSAADRGAISTILLRASCATPSASASSKCASSPSTASPNGASRATRRWSGGPILCAGPISPGEFIPVAEQTSLIVSARPLRHGRGRTA